MAVSCHFLSHHCTPGSHQAGLAESESLFQSGRTPPYLASRLAILSYTLSNPFSFSFGEDLSMNTNLMMRSRMLLMLKWGRERGKAVNATTVKSFSLEKKSFLEKNSVTITRKPRYRLIFCANFCVRSLSKKKSSMR